MEKLYKSSTWGWDEEEKREELHSEHMYAVIARDDSLLPKVLASVNRPFVVHYLQAKGLIGFATIMFDVEDGRDVCISA